MFLESDQIPRCVALSFSAYLRIAEFYFNLGQMNPNKE